MQEVVSLEKPVARDDIYRVVKFHLPGIACYSFFRQHLFVKLRALLFQEVK